MRIGGVAKYVPSALAWVFEIEGRSRRLLLGVVPLAETVNGTKTESLGLPLGIREIPVNQIV